jgi:hypothetical protein
LPNKGFGRTFALMQRGGDKDRRREKSAKKLAKLAESLHSAPMLLASLRRYIHDLGPHVGESVPFPRTRFRKIGIHWCNHLEAARRILSIWVQYDPGITDLVEPVDRYRLAKGFEHRIKASLGIWVLDTEFRELNPDLILDQEMIRYADEPLDLERAKQVLLRPAALVLAKLSEAAAREHSEQQRQPSLMDHMPFSMRRRFEKG